MLFNAKCLCLVFAALFVAHGIAFGQQQAQEHAPRRRCGTPEAMEALRVLHPELESEAEFEKNLAKTLEAQQAQSRYARNFDDVLYIPVVFHIIHQGQPIGTADNLPEAQIQSQLNALNNDFRRKLGTQGHNTDYRGADTKIEFVLAKRTPNGLASNGINRVDATTLGLANKPYREAQLEANIKPRTVWDATRYFNIWVADLDGIYGVAQLPGNSALTGIACNPSPNTANTDGVAISTYAFGSKADGNWQNLDSTTNLGRTATHEVGHWLGLRHIWGDGFCGTDYCEDTPPHAAANEFTCPTHPKPNACGTRDEMFENYMDYSADRCMNIFTRDQMLRMRAVLRTAPRRRELLNSIALVPLLATDAGLAEILAPVRDACTGTGILAKVVVKNWGTTPLTRVNLTSLVGAGSAVVHPFVLNLAPGGTDTLEVPNLTLPAGTSSVVFYTSMPNGQADRNTAQDTLQTVVCVGPGRGLPFSERFEGLGTTPPFWTINNPGRDCKQWRLQAVPQGLAGIRTTAATFQFYQNTAPATLRDELETPLINLTADTAAYLYFNIAHARSANGSAGTLRLEISEDCGHTWASTPLYNKTGNALATTTSASSVEFLPNVPSQWRQEIINLRAYVGKTVRLRFVTLHTGGNNLYLDNIYLANSPPLAPQITRMVPDSGLIGDTIRIYGRHLASTQALYFTAATGFVYTLLNDTTLAAVVPPGTISGHVRVVAPSGTATSPAVFRMVGATQIAGFLPIYGQVGTFVKVLGTNLQRTRKVYFNGILAPGFTVLADTALWVAIPPGATTGKIAILARQDSLLSAGSFIVGRVHILRSGTDLDCGTTLVSPNFPDRYANNLDVTQKLEAPAGQQVILKFLYFSTEANFDKLTIYNGPNTNSPILLNEKSGTFATPPTFMSTNGVLTLRFKTDATTSDIGFAAEATCTPPPPAAITSFSPRQGPVGYTFGLVGTGFDKVDSVWLGTTLVPSFTKTATTLSGIVPLGALSGIMRLKGTNGESFSAANYTVTEGLAYCKPTYPACNGVGLAKINLLNTTLSRKLACSDASGAGFTIYPMADSATGILKAGGIFYLELSANGAGQQVGAWLDYNRNGIYESTEYHPATRQPTSAQTGLIPILPPMGTDTGMLGLRVRSKTNISASDACSTASAGSGADFTLRLVPCQAVAGPARIQTDTVCAGDTASITADGVGTPFWFASATGPAILATGNTLAVVDSNSVSRYVAMVVNNCFSPRVQLAVQINKRPKAAFVANGNTLSVAQSAQGPGITYQWLLDGQPIAGATGLTYSMVASGTYALEAARADGCKALSGSQYLTYTQTRPQSNKLVLAANPNPSQGVFLIKSSLQTLATVQDLLGRTLWAGTLQQTMRVDLSAAGPGVYVLQAKGAPPLRLIIK